MSRVAYVNGRYLPYAEAAVHVEDRGYQFADGVYEVIEVRGGRLIDEAALVEVLRHKRIAGAALDVFEEIDVFALPGPPPAHPLLELDNVILTPHCAGSSVESSLDSKVRGAQSAADVLQGKWPTHVVNAGVVPRFPLGVRP